MDIAKQVLLPNKKVRCRKPDGSDTTFEATPEMIDQIVATGNDLIAAGYDVPLPYEHDLDVVLSLPSTRKKSIYEDPNRNSGFVSKFFKDSEGGLSVLIPEGTAEGKLGKTIKHTSIFLREKFVDTDVNRNKEWKYAPMHIALTNKPTMTGLKGFEKVSDAMMLSMDLDFEGEDANGEDNNSSADQEMAELIKTLKSRFGIVLPKTTTETSLRNSLLIAASNAPEMVPKSSLQKEGSPETTDTEQEVDPETKDEIDEEVQTPPENAKTAKGANTDTGVWAMSQDLDALKAELKKRDEQIQVLLSQKSESALNSFKQRREALAKKGVSADTLARRIDPLLSKKDVLLSQADETMLDALLSTLEETFTETAHTETDIEEALLSQQYIPDGREVLDDDDKAWAFIKKACG